MDDCGGEDRESCTNSVIIDMWVAQSGCNYDCHLVSVLGKRERREGKGLV